MLQIIHVFQCCSESGPTSIYSEPIKHLEVVKMSRRRMCWSKRGQSFRNMCFGAVPLCWQYLTSDNCEFDNVVHHYFAHSHI